MMVAQVDRTPELDAELVAIADIEARADTYAEVAQAAAICLART